MEIRELHSWNLEPEPTRQLQRELSRRLELTHGPTLSEVRTVAGADIGYLGRGASATAYAAVLVFSFPRLELLETQTATVPVDFPYVPGLLSFREGPPLLETFRKVRREPDVILFDAQGYAHPRRLGAASHLGLVLDRPSIGCAKSRLVGRFKGLGEQLGARAPLVDRGEVVGTVVRSRAGRSPLFVSVGHRVNLETAVEIVLACCRGASIMPEPTRRADHLVKELTRAARESGSDQ